MVAIMNLVNPNVNDNNIIINSHCRILFIERWLKMPKRAKTDLFYFICTSKYISCLYQNKLVIYNITVSVLRRLQEWMCWTRLYSSEYTMTGWVSDIDASMRIRWIQRQKCKRTFVIYSLCVPWNNNFRLQCVLCN